MITNITEFLDEAAANFSEKTAFADDKTQLSFLDVDRISRQVATSLIARGCGREPVLVYMEKSPYMIAAFFGVVRAGGYYIPLDDRMPQERIRRISDTCKSSRMIVDESTRDKAAQIKPDGDILYINEISGKGALIDDEALLSVRHKALDTDPVYVVFTSGSTGVPKGVAACHRSVIDYVTQLTYELGFDSDTVFGNQTPLYFDAPLKEIFSGLICGATTYLIPTELFSMPKLLVDYLNDKKINTVCWVVSALVLISTFRTFDEVKPLYLKKVVFGSEVFPLRQYRIWREALPDAEFINLYGPTEATGMSCFYRCSPDGEAEKDHIPIGRPFKNTEVLLIKEDGSAASAGEIGEIYLRGTCVTLGYYNNPEATAKAFVQNPLNSLYPEIVYRTGDMAYLDERGDLVFASRADNQIKHMGHRIELGDIEAAASEIEEVKMCACIWDDRRKIIGLYYVGDIDRASLMEKLGDLLPTYMIPNKLRQLDEMPLTENGKLDRKTLAGMK